MNVFRFALLALLLLGSVTASAQTPAPAPAPTDPVTLLTPLDKAERENIILSARITQLESQLQQALTRLRDAELQQRAATFSAKIAKEYKGKLTSDPQTLELKLPDAAKPPAPPKP